MSTGSTTNNFADQYMHFLIKSYNSNPLSKLNEKEFEETIEFYKEMNKLDYHYRDSEIPSEEEKLNKEIKNLLDNFYTSHKDILSFKEILFFYNMPLVYPGHPLVQNFLRLKALYIWIMKEFSTRSNPHYFYKNPNDI